MYFFVIDEINRCNLGKAFGELFSLIEGDKRGRELRLMYSEETFSIPENVYIIGTMNTADRSIAVVDYALRRRFAFFTMKPAFDSEGFKKLQTEMGDGGLDRLVETVRNLNVAIKDDKSLGQGFEIGHSYLCPRPEDRDNVSAWLSSVVEFELIPLLEEYWSDKPEKAEEWVRELRSAIG